MILGFILILIHRARFGYFNLRLKYSENIRHIVAIFFDDSEMSLHRLMSLFRSAVIVQRNDEEFRARRTDLRPHYTRTPDRTRDS